MISLSYVGSKTFEGVRFAAYVNDHLPPHVHGFYGSAEVVLDLDFVNRRIHLSKRRDSIQPRDAKRADVNKIVRAGRKYLLEIVKLWESAR